MDLISVGELALRSSGARRQTIAVAGAAMVPCAERAEAGVSDRSPGVIAQDWDKR